MELENIDTVDSTESSQIETCDEYNIIERPTSSSIQKTIVKDDDLEEIVAASDGECSKSSTDSDSMKMICPKRQASNNVEPMQLTKPSEEPRKKSNNIWGNILQEEQLMDSLNDCNLISRKRRKSRDIETYDYKKSSKDSKRKKMCIKSSKSKSSSSSSDGREETVPVLLEDILSTKDSSIEDVAKEVAEKLKESNLELILRVVTAIGQELTLDLYQKTAEVERNGGMLILNKKRRRTPGGTFLYLLKSCDNITGDQRDTIFRNPKNCNN